MAAGSLIIGLLNFLLIYSIYGNSESADLYFLLTNGINILFLIVESLVSNYVYEFRMLRTSKERTSAYSTMLIFVVTISISLTFIFLSVYVDIYEFIFNGEGDSSGIKIFSYFINVTSLYLILQINVYSLNSIDKIGMGYIVSFIPQVFSFLSLVAITAGFMESNIDNVFVFLTIGYVFSSILSLFLCLRYIGFSFTLNSDFLCSSVKKSIKSRTAANIHNVFLNYFIISVMSVAQSGTASTFYYGKRIAEMFHLVIYGPLGKQMINSISDSWNVKNYKDFLSIRHDIFFKFPFVYILTLTLLLLILWISTEVTSIVSLDFYELSFVIIMYFAIHVVILFESLYSIISMLTASFRKILLANVTFVIVLICFQKINLTGYLSVHLLCFSILLGQISVFCIHYIFNQELIKNHYQES
ncbi:hypothetical protein AB6D88_12140 [Vibrio cyclitrophicus]